MAHEKLLTILNMSRLKTKKRELVRITQDTKLWKSKWS